MAGRSIQNVTLLKHGLRKIVQRMKLGFKPIRLQVLRDPVRIPFRRVALTLQIGEAVSGPPFKIKADVTLKTHTERIPLTLYGYSGPMGYQCFLCNPVRPALNLSGFPCRRFEDRT